MPEHCQYCFWNTSCTFESEEDFEEAEECSSWTINVV